jgi:hypothetical protein
MDKISRPTSDKPTTKIGQSVNRLNENNAKLIEVRNALRDFVDRTCGESLENTPEIDTDRATQIAPGVLADIDNELIRQSKLLDDMNEVVSAVNKIA